MLEYGNKPVKIELKGREIGFNYYTGDLMA